MLKHKTIARWLANDRLLEYSFSNLKLETQDSDIPEELVSFLVELDESQFNVVPDKDRLDYDNFSTEELDEFSEKIED